MTIKDFVSWAYDRHCKSPHNADFEVCSDLLCRAALSLENAGMIDDGWGQSVSSICPECGADAVVVLGPGQFQCMECGK